MFQALDVRSQPATTAACQCMTTGAGTGNWPLKSPQWTTCTPCQTALSEPWLRVPGLADMAEFIPACNQSSGCKPYSGSVTRSFPPLDSQGPIVTMLGDGTCPKTAFDVSSIWSALMTRWIMSVTHSFSDSDKSYWGESSLSFISWAPFY